MPRSSGGSGAWTLQVSDSSGTHTGAFRLSLERLDVGVGCTPVTYGHDVDAKIAKKASFACFTFTSSAGDVIYARSTGTSGNLSSVSTSRPQPPDRCSAHRTGSLECSVPTSGTQTLMEYSESGQTKGSFVLYLQRMTGPKHCTAVTVGGAKVSGSVPKAGDVACFDFMGKSGTTATATLTSLTGTLAPLIDFFGPTGTSVCASPADERDLRVEQHGDLDGARRRQQRVGHRYRHLQVRRDEDLIET